MKSLLLFALLGLVGIAKGGELVFPPPPRLATTMKELAELRAAKDVASESNKAVQVGENLLKNPVVVPDLPGQWTFYYTNPENGHWLRAKSPTEHVDPATGKVFTDERTIAAYRTMLHDQANQAALDLGWAYVYSGDERFVGEVKRILLKLATDYHTYPERRDRLGHLGALAPLGGRRYAQSLEEAVGVIKLAKAYDLTRLSPAWSAEEQKHVENDFFRPTAESLLAVNQDISNHQTWFNAGIIAIASVLGDREMFNHVLNMKGGYYDQLERSVGPDGLWYEGTMAYQRYALSAVIEAVDAGRRLGVPLQDQPKLHLIFKSPWEYAYPNGQFPAIHDSDRLDISLFADQFKWAARTFDDPSFTNGTVSTHSETLTGVGLAILRQGTGSNAVCAMVEYGPHGGGHGHYDKMNLMLYANHREWILDPGRLSYSVPEYTSWAKTTAAHNTVTIDGTSQNAATGRLLWFETNAVYAACGVEVATAYQHATLRRYLLLTDQILADVFEVESTEPATMDWLVHAISDRIEPPAGATSHAEAPGTHDGYQHFVDGLVYGGTTNQAWDFISDKDKLKLRVWLAGVGDDQVFTARGIGYTLDSRVPVIIRRRKATTTRFVTVYDLTGDGGFVKGVIDEPFAIQTTNGVMHVAFSKTGVTMTEEKSAAGK